MSADRPPMRRWQLLSGLAAIFMLGACVGGAAVVWIRPSEDPAAQLVRCARLEHLLQSSLRSDNPHPELPEDAAERILEEPLTEQLDEERPEGWSWADEGVRDYVDAIVTYELVEAGC